MMQWKYIVLTICLLVACFLIWKELRRTNKARLFGRLIASFIAAACLYFFAVPYYIKSNISESNGDVVILTDGFNQDSLNAFLQLNTKTAVYSFKDYVAKERPTAKTLHVFGDGLLNGEWQQLNASGISLHRSAIPFGITAANWNKHIVNGGSLIVQGSFNNTSSKAVRLKLEAFGTVLDSIDLPPSQPSVFELKTIPLQRGKAVFELCFNNGKDTVREPIPFEAVDAGPLRILMLASSPSFENRFLGNWLFQNGYTVVMRTAISKNKFQQSFLDTSKINVASITLGLLDNFDVLLVDAQELNNLTVSETNVIKQQVAENGLGIIVQTDSASDKNNFLKERFVLAPTASHNKQAVVLQAEGKEVLPALSIETPVYIKNRDNVRALASDNNNNVFAAASLYGEGKIIMNTVPNTNNWVLSGSEKSYASFWSVLIENAAKKSNQSVLHKINGVPLVNGQVSVNVFAELQPSSVADDKFIAWRQNPVIPFMWDGSLWPVKAGWQNIDGFSWYAYDEADWKDLQRQQRINESAAYVSAFKGTTAKVEDNKSNREAIPAVFIWAVFMACCIFLWIEHKLS